MSDGRVVAIAQARMGSTRLPGKVMADLGGEPVVNHVLRRASAVPSLDAVVLATTTLPEDDPLASHVSSLGYAVVRGSAEDVLSRYVKAADADDAGVVVRITADCPLIDSERIAEVVDAFFSEPAPDYCSNTLRRSYPIGMDVEVFSAEALRIADSEATAPHEREHVTPFIYQHPERFSLRNVEAPDWATRPELRLTVDEAEDLRLVREIVAALGPDAGLKEILALLDERPELAEMNAHVGHRHVDKPSSW